MIRLFLIIFGVVQVFAAGKHIFDFYAAMPILMRIAAIVGTLLVIAVPFWLYWRFVLRPAYRRLETLALCAAREHIDALARDRQRMAPTSIYGTDVGRWRNALGEFIYAQVVKPDRRLAWSWKRWRKQIIDAVDVYVASACSDVLLSREFYAEDKTDAGREFEEDCKRHLEEAGWEANIVGGVDDMGADIMAWQDGVLVAIQCKNWARPVDMSAVREVLGARGLRKPDACAVISVSGYTDKAVALARANGVFLLGVLDVPQLADIVAGRQVTSIS